MNLTFNLNIGEVLSAEHCPPEHYLALIHGRLRILQKLTQGKEKTIVTLEAGTILGFDIINDPSLRLIASSEATFELITEDLSEEAQQSLFNTIHRIQSVKIADNSYLTSSLLPSEESIHNSVQAEYLTPAQLKENRSSECLNELLLYYKHSTITQDALYKAKDSNQLIQNIRSFGFETSKQSFSWFQLLNSDFPFILEDHSGFFHWIVGKKGNLLVEKIEDQLEKLGPSSLENDEPYIVIKVHPPEKENEKPYTLDWYFALLKKSWNLSAQMIIASVLIQFVSVCSPIFYMVIFDRVFGHQNLHTLDIMTGGMIIITVFDLLVKFIKSYVFTYQLETIDKIGLEKLLKHIFNIPLSKSNNEFTRNFSQSINELAKNNQILVSTILVTSFDVLFSFLLFAVLLSINAGLTLISIASLVPIFALTFFASPLVQKRAIEHNKEQKNYQIKLTEALESPETVKSLNAGNFLYKNIAARISDTLHKGFQARFDQINAGNLIGFIGNMGSIVTLYFGAHEVLEGKVSYGAYLAINMMSRNLIGSFQKLFSSFQQFQIALDGIGQLQKLYQNKDEYQSSGEGIHLDSIGGHVEFVDLNFRYSDEAPLVLKDINLEIKAGEKIILTGKSGAGKTTLIRLLQRLYEPSNGYILLDNYNLADINLENLRQHIGVALQKSFLYAGTIRENIALGNPLATMKDIVDAASMTQLDQFLLKTKKGFEAPVAALGSNLSGGQAAQIALARIFLKKPSLLILDEALASLDQSLTGTIFTQTLERYKNATCLFVTDYLPVHAQADRIIVLNEGELVESGTQSELINAKGYYYHLFMSELAVRR
jgi:subfamily B ATP-binding cassette protein HlyB/CyaB